MNEGHFANFALNWLPWTHGPTREYYYITRQMSAPHVGPCVEALNGEVSRAHGGVISRDHARDPFAPRGRRSHATPAENVTPTVAGWSGTINCLHSTPTDRSRAGDPSQSAVVIWQ